MANILVVDDDASILAALGLALRQNQHQVHSCSSPNEALRLAHTCALDIVLLDMNYSRDTTSGQEGLQLIEQFQQHFPDLALVVMSGWASIDLAVQSLKLGASDFIEKPWDNKRLLSIIRTQAELCDNRRQQSQLRSENALLKEQLNLAGGGEFVAKSDAMKSLLSTVDKVAKSELNIFLSGENGTGKSLLARYIHQASERCEARLVSVNMGAITDTLFESDMFGHVKGAFTDAKESRIGRLELADKGTLFLDEIGNLPLTQQAKLLRVLEEKQFEKVGSSRTQTVDTRFVSATNADIHGMVRNGEFRQDLLYRLNSVEIRVPALRERKEDIAALAQNMLAEACRRNKRDEIRITPQAQKRLEDYDWPGNIRELQHVIERSVILSSSNCIDEKSLLLHSEDVSEKAVNMVKDIDFNGAKLDDIEKHLIEQRIRTHAGNMGEVAQSLGLSRSAFYRRLEKLNIK